jgi:hypothetical protein
VSVRRLKWSDSGYRQKRMAELSTTTAASVYNQVYHLQKPDYSRDVTEASQKAYVLALLTSSQGTNTESHVLIEIWREVARLFVMDETKCSIKNYIAHFQSLLHLESNSVFLFLVAFPFC